MGESLQIVLEDKVLDPGLLPADIKIRIRIAHVELPAPANCCNDDQAALRTAGDGACPDVIGGDSEWS